MRRDGCQIRARICEGAERVHPADLRRDAVVPRGQERKRATDAEAEDPDALAVDLGAVGQELEGPNDAVDLSNLEPPLEQDPRVGHQNGHPGAREAVRDALDRRMVASDVVHAEDEQDRAGPSLRRCPRGKPQLGELGLSRRAGRSVRHGRPLRRLAEQVQGLRAGIEQVRQHDGRLEPYARRLPGDEENGQDEQHQADSPQPSHRPILREAAGGAEPSA